MMLFEHIGRVDRAARLVGWGLMLHLGMLSSAEGQAHPTAALSSAVSSSIAPLITADFTESKTPLDQQLSRGLRFCQAVFQDTMLNHPDNRPDGMAYQFSLAAITAGRRCLQQIGGGDQVPMSDWAFLLRFAIALNDDSLVHRVVARQLTAAGPQARERASVVEHVIDLLLHNQWPEMQLTEGLPHDHRTDTHTALARQYAAQLDTMHPAGQVIAARLRVMANLNELDTVWNVDTELVRVQHVAQVVASVPRPEIPPEDTAYVHGPSSWTLAWLRYLKTPTHVNLTHWIAVRDSVLPPDSLLGRPAERLTCDYWFNRPSNTPAPAIPALGAVSLIAFGSDFSAERAAQLRQLHTQYPKLKITLVAITNGMFQGQDLHDDPAHEAELIHDHLTNVLSLPGTLCVLQAKYHTERGMTAIPMALPMLDRYHLDPRDYANSAFLVDAEGWLVENRAGVVLDGKLIHQLLVH